MLHSLTFSYQDYIFAEFKTGRHINSWSGLAEVGKAER
jgi:hypothetical protein